MFHDKTYNVGPIVITKHVIEWDDLEDSVRKRLATLEPGATVYLNAEYSVAAPDDAPIERFVKQARRAQVLWNKRLARVLGPANRKKAIKRADPVTRQLTFTGVLFIKGTPQHPKGWPDVQKGTKARSSAG